MVKSSIRKSRETTVITNKVIGFTAGEALLAGIVETGTAIYFVPVDAEVDLNRIEWAVFITQDPIDTTVHYAIILLENDDPSGSIPFSEMMNKAYIATSQHWRNITAVGVVNTTDHLIVDLENTTISRRRNLQDENDYTIVPAWRTGNDISAGQSGTLFLTEKLFQRIFRDATDEWTGYTFEESAQ